MSRSTHKQVMRLAFVRVYSCYISACESTLTLRPTAAAAASPVQPRSKRVTDRAQSARAPVSQVTRQRLLQRRLRYTRVYTTAHPLALASLSQIVRTPFHPDKAKKCEWKNKTKERKAGRAKHSPSKSLKLLPILGVPSLPWPALAVLLGLNLASSALCRGLSASRRLCCAAAAADEDGGPSAGVVADEDDGSAADELELADDSSRAWVGCLPLPRGVAATAVREGPCAWVGRVLGWARVRGGVFDAAMASRSVALGSSRRRDAGPPSALLAKGRKVGESSPLSSSPTSSTLLRGVFFCRWNGGGRLNSWLWRVGGSSASESEEEDAEDEEAGGDGAASSATGKGVASFLRELAAAAVPLNDRCAGCLGDDGGRKCRLCVTVAAEGVRDSSGRTDGVPGAASPRGTGLSLDRIDSEDGALEAAPPPLPNLFMGTPPTVGVCWPVGAAPWTGVGAFVVRSLVICALTCWKCRSYSQAACWRRKGCVTPKSWALFRAS